MARQSYGRGHIIELARGKKYRVQGTLGRDPRTGKYRRVNRTFEGTRRQAELYFDGLRRDALRLDELFEAGVDVDELLSSGMSMDEILHDGLSTSALRDRAASWRAEEQRKVTFADWCETFLSTREGMGTRRRKTLQSDRSSSKHLLRRLGDTRLADLTPATIEAAYADMRTCGVGATATLQAHKLLKQMLRAAVDNDLLLRNPADRVEPPRKPKPDRHSLSAADAARLAAIASTGTPTANKVAVYLGLATGARLGEVLGLTWRHARLDGDRPFLHLVQQHTDEGEISPLKTDKDENPVGRVVPIDRSTVAVLLAWRAEQRRRLADLGVEPGTETPIVTNSVGDWADNRNFSTWWRGFCVENGFGRWVADDGREIVELAVGDDESLHRGCLVLWRDADGWPCDADGRRYSRTHRRPKVKRHYRGLHFHELRHSHFTLRLAAGMDIPTCQALGGWSTPDVLLKTYAHPLPEAVWASAGFMDRLTEAEPKAVR